MTSLRDFKTIQERRSFLEKEKNLSLSAISFYPNTLDDAATKNCENMVGAVQVPVGIAGPLRVAGEYAKGVYFIPLATTEGALVASVNRGCKAVAASGVRVIAENMGMSRGAIFRVTGSAQGSTFRNWIAGHMDILASEAKKTSSHITLLSAESRVVGREVYVRFVYDTKDAMGMNMATYATQHLSEIIQKECSVTCLAVAGNFDVDKKPSWMNAILGRGKRIHAEARIAASDVSAILKATPQRIEEVVRKKCLIGSAISGSMGFNAHFANIVAALFIATGQDPAHTVEGSVGITTTDIVEGDLFITVDLPDLPVGTIGGGTGLPAQQEMLQLLGVAGGNDGNNALAFAEITGAAVLAGELSLLASLAQGSLAQTHRKLTGREEGKSQK